MNTSQKMGKRAIAIAVVAALVCVCIAMAGCQSYEPQSSEDDALRYYQDKYGGKASVAESHGLGNYNLFGYSYSGMEYIMSDGTSVIYLDGEGEYRDNRQSVEIQEAAKSYVEGKLAAIPGALTSIEVESVGNYLGFETYEGEGYCWHARYDGDIESFLQDEWPYLNFENHYSGQDYGDGRFSYSVAYDETQAGGLEDAYLDLSRYVDLRSTTLAVVDRTAFEASGDTLSLFDDGLKYTVTFKGDSSAATQAVRFKPVFVKLADGMTISSSTRGVTLQEGDVRFYANSDGFYECRIIGDAAAQDDMSYYIHNDTGNSILKVNDIDSFSKVCGPYEHLDYCKLVDGGRYYIGPSSDIVPRIEVESVTGDKVVVCYHTHFKDQVSDVSLRVIGMASRDGSGSYSTYESTEFESRIIGETDDGWRCEVSVPKGAKRDNTLCFQFTYNDDEGVSVQIEQPVELP